MSHLRKNLSCLEITTSAIPHAQIPTIQAACREEPGQIPDHSRRGEGTGGPRRSARQGEGRSRSQAVPESIDKGHEGKSSTDSAVSGGSSQSRSLGGREC